MTISGLDHQSQSFILLIYKYYIPERVIVLKNVHPGENDYRPWGSQVDNHFRKVNIVTITLSGMKYLFCHTEILEYICGRHIFQTKSTSFWPYRTKVRE